MVVLMVLKMVVMMVVQLVALMVESAPMLVALKDYQMAVLMVAWSAGMSAVV